SLEGLGYWPLPDIDESEPMPTRVLADERPKPAAPPPVSTAVVDVAPVPEPEPIAEAIAEPEPAVMPAVVAAAEPAAAPAVPAAAAAPASASGFPVVP